MVGMRPDDAFLAAQVVGTNRTGLSGFGGRLVGFAGNPLQQCVDFFLGKEILGHGNPRPARAGVTE
jgi:hypothetical protein